MNEQDIKGQIRELLAALHSGARDDAELRALLGTLERDVHDALARTDSGGGVLELGVRARDLTTRFALKHPRLEPVLEELANLVASIGV